MGAAATDLFGDSDDTADAISLFWLTVRLADVPLS